MALLTSTQIPKQQQTYAYFVLSMVNYLVMFYGGKLIAISSSA